MPIYALLVAACAKQQQPPPAAPLTVQDVAAPREESTGAIGGVVKSRDYGQLSLDSGGPNQIPLRVDPQMQITRDDQPATGLDIMAGDVVRAAYKLDDSGTPQAIKVVVNSRPVSGRSAAPPVAAMPVPPPPSR